jgi:hypothetical protein
MPIKVANSHYYSELTYVDINMTSIGFSGKRRAHFGAL